MRRFDLRSLRFGDAPETWRRLPIAVAPFVFGGLEYEIDGGSVDALLTAARVGSNLTLTLTFDATVGGPCQRCLGAARLSLDVRGLDYVRQGESETADEEERYVTAATLDVERWVRDLVADALPAKLLCREDCRGLCPICGADLNACPEHRHD